LTFRWENVQENLNFRHEEELGLMGGGDVVRRARLTWLARVLKTG
jgi:hypothetical protein